MSPTSGGGRPAAQADRRRRVFTSRASKKVLARANMQQRVSCANVPTQTQLGSAARRRRLLTSSTSR